jgi:hypothetical protein
MLSWERVTLTHRLGLAVAAVSTVSADSVASVLAEALDEALAEALGDALADGLAEAEAELLGVGVGVGVDVLEPLGVLVVGLGVGLVTAGGVGLDEEVGTLTTSHC